jgi:HlyD family secretion protein
VIVLAAVRTRRKIQPAANDFPVPLRLGRPVRGDPLARGGMWSARQRYVNRRRVIVSVTLLATLVAAGVLYYRRTHASSGPAPVTVAVTRGNVVHTVDATGTVEAVTTVQVGSQVSGTIQSLYVDFNSSVRRGQVIARLDPSLFQTQVDQAQATLLRLQADLERTRVDASDTQRKFQRAQELFAQLLIPRSDLETAEANALQAQAATKSAEAQIAQARASWNQAQVNLAHTVITAPIDGIVISRNVDVGQTVAATMQAPTLFVIARDLTHMQVRASVNEADVGAIQPGQPVSFRVDAYPDETFSGSVTQVRLQPIVEQNVVSYTTVIDVPNPDMDLRPGMTANVTIEIARDDDVLRVPNAALRFRPTADLFAALAQKAPLPLEPGSAPVATAGRGRQTAQAPERASPARSALPTRTEGRGHAAVWVLRDGPLESVNVRLGVTDGVTTAVLAGDLAEGDQVVTGTSVDAATAQTTRSPLLPFGGRRPGAPATTPASGGGRR